MNYKKYLEMRDALIVEAENFLAENKTEEANEKMVEVKELDDKWEATKLSNANIEALKDKSKITDLENEGKKVEGAKVMENIVTDKVVDEKELYVQAWAKKLLKANMTEDETTLFNKVNNITNAYTHTTSISTLIPETVVQGIQQLMMAKYPLLADVKKLNVPGNITKNKHATIASGDAAWYLEATPVADEENTFDQFTLTGHELAKAVTVSWKMQVMSVEDFIPFLQAELANRLGVALANAVTNGSGENQPTGIVTVLEAEVATPQIVGYDALDGIVYADITEAVGLLHETMIEGSAIYANSKTIWNQLANILDEFGRPMFIPDVTNGGVGRMFGLIVKPEGTLAEGSVLIGNASEGYWMNTNQQMKLVTEDHAKARATDYVAYEIVDGDVYENKAFALIKKSL